MKLHHRAKASDETVAAARAEYFAYIRGYKYIAKKYGCGVATARDWCTFRTRKAAK